MSDMEGKAVDYLEYIRERVSKSEMLERLSGATVKMTRAVLDMVTFADQDWTEDSGDVYENFQESVSDVETWLLLLGYSGEIAKLSRECIRREKLLRYAERLREMGGDYETN